MGDKQQKKKRQAQAEFESLFFFQPPTLPPLERKKKRWTGKELHSLSPFLPSSWSSCACARKPGKNQQAGVEACACYRRGGCIHTHMYTWDSAKETSLFFFFPSLASPPLTHNSNIHIPVYRPLSFCSPDGDDALTWTHTPAHTHMSRARALLLAPSFLPPLDVDNIL